uniref:Receptor ligand binding region domain-containing protein n=1 Tax=Cucumis sativus TaxID=3659 RepID=A0A0A0KG62_CUCSA
MQASFLIDVGDKAQVSIISFSATRPSLTSHRGSYFFRITQADSFQGKAIAAIVKAFKWRKIVSIYVDNEFGDGIIPFLVDALQEVDANVSYQSVISLTATNDEIELKLSNLMNMQTRVFVVHMLPPLASRLFIVAKKKGMMGPSEFGLVNGQLQSFVFEIVNVVGNERRSVGFWTPKAGLTTSLRHSGRKRELRPII